MKILVVVLAAALSAIAGAALADGPAQATLQNPVAKQFNLIAGDSYWSCQGSVCASGSATDQALTISACKTIAKAAGPVTAFSVGRGKLSDAQLVKCNAVASSVAKAN